MRIFNEIELFKIIGKNKIKYTNLWHICFFKNFKICAAEFL